MTFAKNSSRSFLKSIAFIMLATFTLVSCKKDNDIKPTTTIPIEGLYAGKYGFDNDVPDAPEKYNIKTGGVFQQVSINNGSVVATGTWQLNGNSFTANCTSIFAPYSKESINATFNNSTGKLIGTWGWDNSYTDGGKIELTRQ